jgi:hypothetical protein
MHTYEKESSRSFFEALKQEPRRGSRQHNHPPRPKGLVPRLARRPLGAYQLFFPPDVSATGLKFNAAPFMQ